MILESVDPNLLFMGGVAFGAAVAVAVPSILDSMHRRARLNAAIDLIDQAQKFDFARDTIAGRESSEFKEKE